MPLTPPFNTADYLAAVGTTFEMDVNAVREHDKPRASSLGSCARQQAFMMAGTPHDETGKSEASARSTDGELTAEQGRMFEDLSVRVIENMGFGIVDRQLCIGHPKCTPESIQGPEDFPVSGHPDGRLVQMVRGEWKMEPYDAPLADGLTWGWEHKHLGRYAYEKIIKEGLMKAEPVFIMQGGMYGYALGWDASLFTIIAQDSSSTRGDMTANLRAKNPAVRWATIPGINPKVNIIPVDMKPVQHGLVPMGINRALWLSDWKKNDGDPGHVAREYDPTIRVNKWVPDGAGGRMEIEQAPFPCGWCPYLEKCLAAGGGGNSAPALPWTESVEADDA